MEDFIFFFLIHIIILSVVCILLLIIKSRLILFKGRQNKYVRQKQQYPIQILLFILFRCLLFIKYIKAAGTNIIYLNDLTCDYYNLI